MASAQTSLAKTRQRADQGDADSQYNLGFMYNAGEGVPQDFVEAHKWVNLAASRATGDTQKQYAEIRGALAKQMTCLYQKSDRRGNDLRSPAITVATTRLPAPAARGAGHF